MHTTKLLKSLSLLFLSIVCFCILISCADLNFKVEFIVDGEVYETVSAKEKSEIKIPKNPEKEGFTFDGWYLDEGTWDDPFTANSLLDTPISDDMIVKVYARFIPVTEEHEDFLFKVCEGGYEVFGYTGSDTTVAIPSEYNRQPVVKISVDYNNNNSFSNNPNIKELIIPDSVTVISGGAFINCTGLTSITIPDSITELGIATFYGCDNITYANVPTTVLHDIPKNNLSTLVINGGTSIPDYLRCEKLTDITICDGITSIGDGAFSNCKNLKSIILPESITSIGKYAFADCESLTSITIPSDITSLEDGVFAGCKSLNNVIISNNIKYIGRYAFQSCDALTSLTFQNPNGWQSTYGEPVASSILSNPQAAASHLVEYSYSTFQRN